MDKLGELLNVLKENKLDKTYNRIMTDLADIKSALSVVNDEVNDSILVLLTEGKYEEVGKLSTIPNICSAFYEDFNKVVKIENSEFLEEKIDIEDKEETMAVCSDISIATKLSENVVDENSGKEDILEYSGIITSRKGLKKGAQVMHKIYGLGKVVSLEDTQNGNGKVLRVMFDSCGEKPFSCTSEILSKYFDIEYTEDDANEENINLSHKGKSYNLYTSFNYFIGKKPYKIKIFDRNFYAKSWSEAAVVLFRYIYDENKEAFCKFREVIENKGFSVNSDELRRPLLVRGDIYYEANRSAIDTLTIMSSIAEQYGNIINKPMRKDVELFIKDE